MENIEEKIKRNFLQIIDDFFSSLNNDKLPKEVQKYLAEDIMKEFREVSTFRGILTKETDRGCALIAASFLENKLEMMLKNFLVNDKDVVNQMFGANGPLGTFSAKIDMTYTLGLISKKIHRDLNLVRKIRNEFGHNPEPISFETNLIKNRCMELYHNYIDLEVSSRDNFTRTICGILGIISIKNISLEHIKPAEDIQITGEKKQGFTSMAINIIDEAIRETMKDNDI